MPNLSRDEIIKKINNLSYKTDLAKNPAVKNRLMRDAEKLEYLLEQQCQTLSTN